MANNLTYAYIETSSYCNLNCSFCNREEVVGVPTNMTLENFAVILDKLKRHPIKEIKLMGMGEPFMHPKFSEICRLTRETFPSAKIISSTNCQYNFNANVKRALSYIDVLYLSIDGHKESYERFRKPSKWSKLITFLGHLRNNKVSTCSLAINYTVNPENVFDIPRVEQLLSKFDLDELRLNVVQNWNETESAEKLISGFSNEQLSFLKDKYQHLIKGKAEWDYPDCFWVKNGIYVTANADVKICCMNTSAEPIGNLLTDVSTSLIHSRNSFISIRNGCETNSPTKHCAQCSYKELIPVLSKLL